MKILTILISLLLLGGCTENSVNCKEVVRSIYREYNPYRRDLELTSVEREIRSKLYRYKLKRDKLARQNSRVKDSPEYWLKQCKAIVSNDNVKWMK